MSFASVVVTVLLILYPVLVYLGLSYSRISAVAVLLIVVSIARVVLRDGRIGPLAGSAPWISAGGVLLAGTVLLKGSVDAMLFYPVFVNLVLFGVFVHSLIYPPTVITRLAAVREPDLPRSAIRYTRNVTVIWSIFFLINGSVSLYTALCTTVETWTLYNGFVAYLLIGALIGGEWLLRARFKG